MRKVQKNRKPEAAQKRPPEILMKWAYGPGPVEDMDFMTTEHAHELMWAVLKGKPYTRVVNILNDGFIAGLPKRLRRSERHRHEKRLQRQRAHDAHRVPCAPPAVDLHPRAELRRGERRLAAARQALFLDPLVPDMYDIEPMLNDFADRLGKWMPHFVKGHK